MPKLLITGANGYIANAVKRYFTQKGGYEVRLLDVRGTDWEQESFADTDCVLHAAALVHKDERQYPLSEYERVNTLLTQKLAEKAKADGAAQFVFLSTAAVYGAKPSLFHQTFVDRNTPCRPVTKYGVSKYKAEQALRPLGGGGFALCIVRPPMVYGKDCPGNYQSLRRLVLRLGVCPRLPNQKSMIHIDNLCAFLYRVCAEKTEGTYVPQNEAYVKTHELAALIADCNNKRLYRPRWATPFVMAASLCVPALRKAFGSEYYHRDLSDIGGAPYCVLDWETSVRETERREQNPIEA